MAMVQLVESYHGGRARPISLVQISENQGISINYLEQLFIKLKKHGLVESVRGAQGGYILALPPAQISVKRILDAAGEHLKATQCSRPNEGCLPGGLRCKVHHVWEGLENQVIDFLDSITLASLSLNSSSFQRDSRGAA